VTTSGTVGQTTITVQQIIDHAFRRAGVSPAEQSIDSLIAAQENLYFYLCSLANTGINLWTLEPIIIGTIVNQSTYNVGIGTIDIVKLLYRTVANQCTGGTPATSAGGNVANAFNGNTINLSCIQTSANGNLSYNFASNVIINNVGIMTYGDQTYTLVWEVSNDGINWTQVYPASNADPAAVYTSVSFTDSVWQYYDIPTPVSATYMRVRETGGGVLSVRQVCFNIIQLEINVARMNVDIYTTLTNKTFSGNNQLQYWFNRAVKNPQLKMWPTTDTYFDQLVAWRTRQIQDVGIQLTNTLELPDRWIESVITELARRQLLETPGADPKRYQILKDEADAATALAQSEERDKSPIQLSPNIWGYTR